MKQGGFCLSFACGAEEREGLGVFFNRFCAGIRRALIAQGVGRTKKEAEQEGARLGLEEISSKP